MRYLPSKRWNYWKLYDCISNYKVRIHIRRKRMKPYLKVFLKDSVWQSNFEVIHSLKELNLQYAEVMSHKDEDLRNAETNKQIYADNAKEFQSIVSLAKSYGFKA